MREVEVDHETVQAVVRLLCDHPELDLSRLRHLVEGGGNGGRQPRGEPMRPRSVTGIAALIDHDIMSPYRLLTPRGCFDRIPRGRRDGVKRRHSVRTAQRGGPTGVQGTQRISDVAPPWIEGWSALPWLVQP